MSPRLLKALVVSNVLIVLLVVLGGLATLVASSSRSSTAALSGADRFAQYETPAAMAPPPMPSMAAPMEEAKVARKERARADVAKKGLAALIGSGEGGGGVGGIGSLGIGSVGGRGRGAGGFGSMAVALEGGAAAPEPDVAAPRTRAWFPETFLFEPRIVTDAEGLASLSVKVPDRLTTWRVLALAHSRDGAQAGATASFLGTLDTYVDPVVPALLHAGDSVRLPVQVVNTTATNLTRALKVSAAGAKLSGAGGSVSIAANSTNVSWVTLTADEPGSVTLEATLAGADAVVREIPVVPTGRPYEERRTGTLAAPRELAIDVPGDVDTKSARARLVVYPGALALLRSELSTSGLRGGLAEDAYLLRIAGDAPGLLAKLGDDPDRELLRTTTLLATQRVLRDARPNDPAAARLLLEATLAHHDSPVLQRLSDRLVQAVAASQRPDGTCGGGNGQTLQRVIVTTAECVRVVNAGATDDAGKRRATAMTLRASGVAERYLGLVLDAYSAAALVSSGVAQGTVAEQLRDRIRKAAKANDDGSQSITVEPEVGRADGYPPVQAEADALAILALDPVKDASLRSDLGASLLARYSPAYGWGDGRTNLAALRATVELFKDGLPGEVKIELLQDGQPIAAGTLAPKAKDPLALEGAAPAVRGHHTWSLRATPSVPGLAYAFELSGYRPWTAEAMQDGLELSITLPKALAVGEAAQVDLEAAAPSGHALKLTQALPAGVQPDRASLDALVSNGAIRSFELADGRVTLHLAAREPGSTFHASFRVVPTLAGTLHADASTLALEDSPTTLHHVLPIVWNVK